MAINAVLAVYQARLVELQATIAELRSGQTTAFAAVGLAIGAILLLGFFSLAKHRLPSLYGLVPVPLALYWARLGKKRSSALQKSARLEDYYRRGIDRLEGRWAGQGERGEEFARIGHGYAADLQVIGEGSLFELLCTCRTEVGRRRLAGFLLDPPSSLKESAQRQDAAKELKNRVGLREQINLIGNYGFQQATWTGITEWLDSPPVRFKSWFQVLAFTASTALSVLFLLGFAAVTPWSVLVYWIAGLLLLNGLLGLVFRAPLLTSLPAMRSLASELGVLREGLELMQVQKFDSSMLAGLTRSAESGAPAHLRQLESLLGALVERDKEWFYAISRALLVGTQLFLVIEKWRARHADSTRRWLNVWGEFEALMALANYAYEHPDNTFPKFVESPASYEGEKICHPLLPANTCVRNDISFNERVRFYVISGSNMAGKSTVLRAIGLNAVLGYAGAPVCARSLELSRFSVCASLSIQDSLLHGKSKFMAEIERLKQALTVPPECGPVLFLIDEILSGTNSRDRRTASESIIRALVRQGGMGALSTHDLTLTELAELEDLQGENVHMSSRSDDEPLAFDYVLKLGVANQANALAIARLAGVPI